MINLLTYNVGKLTYCAMDLATSSEGTVTKARECAPLLYEPAIIDLLKMVTARGSHKRTR